ncbi:hypothetical protein M422DRAFT_179711, partial [Sphaerobolus stellatus SS14]
WITKFLEEYPGVCGFKARGLDLKQAAAFNKEWVYDFFNKLEDIIEAYQILCCNAYNMDKKGIQLGGGHKNSNTLYFFDKENKSHYILKSDSLVLVTIIECACADGTMDVSLGFLAKPMIIVISHIQIILRVTETENGWTDDAICYQWFNKVFIPFAKSHSDATKPIPLVFDDHGSHEALEMIDYAYEHGIILGELSPHRTHRLQPLDVGIFGPL